MRQLRILYGVAIMATVASAASDVWRPPPPPPGQCREATFEVLLIDKSKSMRQAGAFSRATNNISDHISRAPACTLEIVASFGITADVDAGVFLINQNSRNQLVDAVKKLRPDQADTNFDEAAKLVELLSYQLHEAYGLPSDRLRVRVYSDLVISPSAGEHPYSLAEYLAQRMGAKYQRGLSAANLDGPGAPRSPGRPLSVRPILRHADNTHLAAIAVGFLTLAALFAWLCFRPRRSSSGTAVPLAALLVTERRLSPGSGTPETIRNQYRIQAILGVPVVFSTFAERATYVVAETAGSASGEIFRVQPLPDGGVRIQSPHSRLTVNDEPLDLDRRRRVDIHEPIRVCLGPWEFSIVGVFGPQTADRGYDVFDAEPLQR